MTQELDFRQHIKNTFNQLATDLVVDRSKVGEVASAWQQYFAELSNQANDETPEHAQVIKQFFKDIEMAGVGRFASLKDNYSNDALPNAMSSFSNSFTQIELRLHQQNASSALGYESAKSSDVPKDERVPAHIALKHLREMNEGKGKNDIKHTLQEAVAELRERKRQNDAAKHKQESQEEVAPEQVQETQSVPVTHSAQEQQQPDNGIESLVQDPRGRMNDPFNSVPGGFSKADIYSKNRTTRKQARRFYADLENQKRSAQLGPQIDPAMLQQREEQEEGPVIDQQMLADRNARAERAERNKKRWQGFKNAAKVGLAGAGASFYAQATPWMRNAITAIGGVALVGKGMLKAYKHGRETGESITMRNAKDVLLGNDKGNKKDGSSSTNSSTNDTTNNNAVSNNSSNVSATTNNLSTAFSNSVTSNQGSEANSVANNEEQDTENKRFDEKMLAVLKKIEENTRKEKSGEGEKDKDNKKSLLDKVKDFIGNLPGMKGIKSFLGKAQNLIRGGFGGAMAAAKNFGSKILTTPLKAAKGVTAAVTNALSKGAAFAKSAASAVIAKGASVTSSAAKMAKGAASRGIEALKSATSYGVDVAKSAGGKGISALKSIASKGVNVGGSLASKAGGVAKSAASVAGKATSALGNLGGLAANGLGGLGKLAAGAAKFAGPIGLALTAGMALKDGYAGFNNASENLGIEGREATFGEKLSSGAGSALSGLSFGMLDAKSMSKGIASLTGAGPSSSSSAVPALAGASAVAASTLKSNQKSELVQNSEKSNDSLSEISSKLSTLISTMGSSGGSGGSKVINNTESTLVAGGINARSSDSTFQRYLDRRPVFA